MTQDKCIGTGCPGCEAARQHYKATGCLDPECARDHGRVDDAGVSR